MPHDRHPPCAHVLARFMQIMDFKRDEAVPVTEMYNRAMIHKQDLASEHAGEQQQLQLGCSSAEQLSARGAAQRMWERRLECAATAAAVWR